MSCGHGVDLACGIERGRANPTLETLERIAKPWGWKVGFVPPVE